MFTIVNTTRDDHNRTIMASDNYEEKYTKPELRRQLKEEIKQSDKGGEPGQWSARKSQLLVQEYEKQGGGYKKDEKDRSAESLEEWGEQNWQTKEGKGQARQEGKTKRYLPKEVWEKLSNEEKKEAEQTKKEASQDGDQYVEWTPAIKRAMKEAGYLSDDDEPTKQELYEEAQELDISDRSKMNKDELQQAVSEAKADDTEDDLADMTKDELYEQAQELDISDRSKMNKDELLKAVRKAK